MACKGIDSAAERDGLLHVERHVRQYKSRTGLSIEQLWHCAGIQAAELALIKSKSLMLRQVWRCSAKMDRLLIAMSTKLIALVDSLTDQIMVSEDLMGDLLSRHVALLPDSERFGIALRSARQTNVITRTFCHTLELLNLAIEEGEKFPKKFLRLDLRNRGVMEKIQEINRVRSSRIEWCAICTYYEPLLTN